MGEYSPFFYANIFVTSLLALLALLIMSALNRSKMDRLSPKVTYFYALSMLGLLFVSGGVSVLITILADIASSSGILQVDAKKALVACTSVLFVATPIYLFHWFRLKGGLGLNEEVLLAWPAYKFTVLGLSAALSTAFLIVLFYQFMNGVLDTAEFDSNLFNKALGSAIVGLTVWTYHWFVKVGSSEEEKSSKELEPQLG